MNSSKAIALIAVLATACHAPAQYPQDPVKEALKQAGKNRVEIQKVLEHYRNDPQKLEAAKFLIGNMIGKAYKVVVTVDKKGTDVGFDALKYKSLDEALNAYDALERKYGQLEDKQIPLYDLQTLSSDFLIGHIDLAFRAWKELPWAQAVDWEIFKNFVLPYRSGKEPAEAWRPELMARYSWVPRQMKDKSSLQEASALITADINEWVTFWDLYYMHPTEQGYSEMKRSRKGRCGDLSNFTNTVLRANGIPCTIDYTPYWPASGNNHAWPVTLSATGVASDASVGKAAKIYRKTYANQPANLIYHQRKGEVLPPWLNRPDYIDVTDQYLPTTDVALNVDTKAPHAYLCVFNDGEFRPIQWADVVDGKAVFKGMGRDILYLPAAYGKRGVVPVANPFVLTKEGAVQPIEARSEYQTLELEAKSEGKTYTLSVWQNGWKTVGAKKAASGKVVFDRVPVGGLYWLVQEGSRKEERPFLVVDGKTEFR